MNKNERKSKNSVGILKAHLKQEKELFYLVTLIFV